MSIGIIDYGLGNVGSIKNILRKLGAEAKIISDVDEVRRAEKLILPGVGAFDHAMRKVGELGIRAALDDAVLQRQVPIAGICLGMQLMTERSDEGGLPGFGWIPARTRRFTSTTEHPIKVPHMGWCPVGRLKESAALRYLLPESRFYFVHSYYVTCDDRADALLSARYGPIDFDAAFEKGNILGFQFHPEKSHKHGMGLLKGFLERS